MIANWTKETLVSDFNDYWISQQFAKPHQTVLLTVSGGADSMVLAYLFLKNEFKFAIAHCNFQLRGEEADKDENLIKEWCKVNNIQFHTIRFDTKQKVEEWKKGTQETARILRYEWFEQLRTLHNYAGIVTAHHANDNVETMLINLFKGTGISGMHGILPVNGYLIRPLLNISKEVILEFAKENNVPYRNDESNFNDDYLRNAVRLNLIPQIKKYFPNIIDNVNESIVRFKETEILFNIAIEEQRKELLEKRGEDYYISILKLKKREALNTIFYEFLKPFGFSSLQIPHVLQLLNAETGRFVASNSHRILRNRNFLIIAALPTVSATDFILIDAVPCSINIGTMALTFSIVDKKSDIIYDPRYAYIDVNEIEFPLILRRKQTGDYFYPIGLGMKKKKISRFLIDQKVPLHEKENIWILECNKKIVWVAGYRLDERFKVKNNAEKLLLIKIN